MSPARPTPLGETAPGRAARLRERRCIATNEVLPDRLLVRFVLGPDSQIVPDVAAKLPGRGAWVRSTRETVDIAVKKNAFARAFKTGLKPQAGLADQTEQLLARRVLELLGLARRAGALALGKDQVDSAIRARRQIAMVEASDGSADGREKLLGLHRGRWDAPAPMVGCFTGAELGMALGRAHVIHACFVQERLALAWAAEIDRLAGFRAIVPTSWPTSWPYNAVGLGVADDEPSGSASSANELDFDPET